MTMTRNLPQPECFRPGEFRAPRSLPGGATRNGQL